MRYSLEGDSLPVVIMTLSNGESVFSESGGMAWMSPNMEMDTTSKGGIGGALGRMFSGESLFLNKYTARGGDGLIAFASSFPGQIRPFVLTPGKDIVLQKSAFLACESTVKGSVFFNRKLGAGFFGGEGFIMQRFSGSGVVFCEFDGHVVEYDLAPGQQIIIDTGYLAAMDATCTMDIQRVRGLKNIAFGGEGLFNTVVTGPGKVYIQSMPVARLADLVTPVQSGN